MTDQIIASLPGGTFAVALWLTTFGYQHGVLIELLDSASNVLGPTIGSATNDFALDTFVGLISDSPIARVRMTSTQGGTKHAA